METAADALQGGQRHRGGNFCRMMPASRKTLRELLHRQGRLRELRPPGSEDRLPTVLRL